MKLVVNVGPSLEAWFKQNGNQSPNGLFAHEKRGWQLCAGHFDYQHREQVL